MNPKSAIICLAICLLVAMGTPVLEAATKSPPQKCLLPNGLRVIVGEDHSLPFIGATILFQTGANGKVAVIPGMNRLLLPILEKGESKGKTRSQLISELENAGCSSEFYETYPILAVGCQGPSDSLDTILTFLREAGFDAKPTRENLEIAKQLVIRHLKDSQSFPLSSGRLFDETCRRLFPGTPLAGLRSTPEDVSRISLDDVQAAIGECCSSNNAVLAIVGDVDSAAVFKKCLSVFGDLPAKPLPQAEPPKAPPPVEGAREGQEFLEIKTSQVLVSFAAPAYLEDDSVAAILWETHLGESNESWLEKTFAREFPDLKNIHVSYKALPGHGVFSFGFESSNPEIDRVVTSLLNHLTTLWMNVPRDEDLQRLKTVCRGRIMGGLEIRLNHAGQLAFAEFAKDFGLLGARIEAIKRVTSEDLAKVAKRIFTSPNYFVQIAHPLSCQIRKERRTKLETLPNGFKLLVKSYAGSEMAGACLNLRLTRASEEKGKEGLSDLLMAYYEELVAQEEGRDSLARKLDSMGGGLNLAQTDAGYFFTGSAARENILDLLTEIRNLVFSTKFEKGILEKAKQRLRNKESQVAEDPIEQMFAGFNRAAFPGTYLARVGLTSQQIDPLTIADLEAFHKAQVVPAVAVCSVVGNLDPEETFGKVDALFRPLSGGRPNPPTLPDDFRKPLPAIQEVEIKTAIPKGSALLGVGYRLPPIKEMMGASGGGGGDFAAITVLFNHLTWSRNGLIDRELGRNGILGEITGNILTSTHDHGFMYFTLRVPQEKVAEARMILRKTLENLSLAQITERDIKAAGKLVEGYFLVALQKSNAQAQRFSGFLAGEMGADFIETLPGLYHGIDPKRVQEAIKRYFGTFVLVTGLPES